MRLVHRELTLFLSSSLPPPLSHSRTCSTLALLNFLSGYRPVLHRLTGRGAYSTILSLVLAAYLSSPSPTSSESILSAQGMSAATPAHLADLARISTHTERAHESLPVTVGVKDDEAFEVLELLAGALRETGDVLQREGCPSLGVWVRGALERADGSTGVFVHEVSRLGSLLARCRARGTSHVERFRDCADNISTL